MTTTLTIEGIHVHEYDPALSAWICRTCDLSTDDCDAMTETDARGLEGEGYNLVAFRVWCDQTGEAFVYENRHDFSDAFCGEWDSFREYADELADELLDSEGLGTESLARRHFDYDGFARDLLLGGDNFTTPAEGYGVFVFRSF